jgi:hypothetical protein
MNTNWYRSAAELLDNSEAVRRNRPAVREMTLRSAKERGVEITPHGDLVLYHGTSSRNARLIERQGKLYAGTYFGGDEQTARQFSGQAVRGNDHGVVLKLVIDPSAVFAGSYWSLNEEVLLGADGVYRPKP